jgi:UDP-N-acetylglucosamine:LPS N-acetylglucosamine transferase
LLRGGESSAQALKRRLGEFAAAHSLHLSPRLHVVGSATEMDEYMAAADLLLGKPGRLTLAYKIDRLLADPARLAAMRANARHLARPHAAWDIGATRTGEDEPLPGAWAG